MPTLTTIADTILTADGTPFTGQLTITWETFTAADGSTIPTEGIALTIAGGLLQTHLIPTTDASPGARYSVTYTSEGSHPYSENWAVPPSPTPLRVAGVRMSVA